MVHFPAENTQPGAVETVAHRHTPGPWERLEGIVEKGHPDYIEGRLIVRIVQKRAPGQTHFVKVALVDAGPVHANARLIAAAPDGLAFAQHYDAYMSVSYDGPTSTALHPLARETWKMCRAFIAKATTAPSHEGEPS